MELKTKDRSSWTYLQNNFSINKTGIPFSFLGSDHALEQKNKVLKVNGGVIGLTQNPGALYRFCLISPTLHQLISTILGNGRYFNLCKGM